MNEQRAGRPRPIITFAKAIWGCVFLAVFALLSWPFIAGAIAARTWDRIPCFVAPSGTSYYYVVETRNGEQVSKTKYYSERVNFWDTFHTTSHMITTTSILTDTNDWCYVKPGDPMNSVLHPDTYHYLGGMVPRLWGGGILVVGAAVITLRKPKGSPKKTV